MDVSITDLHLRKGGRTVLRIPELRFSAGTTTAVFGPNGSGKTSLLRAIAGLDLPASGEVWVGGSAVDREPAARRLVSIAFQNPVFLRGSVRQNLDLALRLRDIAGPERRVRIEEAAAECGVTKLLERPAGQLSGGEAQRVNLARVLVLRAPVTLLDEPLSGVDRIGRTQLLAELPDLLAKFTATTILVTHDREEAFRLADRLVVLMEGEVRAEGSKGAVYTNPPDRATAELLGYTVLNLDGHEVAVPPGGLRPGNGSPTLTLDVERAIDMGNYLHLVGRIGADRVDIRLPGGVSPPRPGSTIAMTPVEFVQLPPRAFRQRAQ